MAPEDISHLLNTEGGEAQQPEQTQPTNTEAGTAPAEEASQEPQYIRVGEREYSPDDLGTKLRIAEDYEKEFAALRKQQRATWEREQRAAEIERLWEQHQSQQSQHQPATPQAADDDPIAMLRNLNSEIREMRQIQAEERQFYKQQLEQQWLENQAAQANEAYKSLNSWVEQEATRTGRNLPKFTLEELEQEAIDSGLAANKRLPWGDVLTKAYRNLAWESAMQAAERAPIQRVQHPRATVTVPSARGGAPAPAPAPTPEQQIGGMTVAEMRELFPERR